MQVVDGKERRWDRKNARYRQGQQLLPNWARFDEMPGDGECRNAPQHRKRAQQTENHKAIGYFASAASTRSTCDFIRDGFALIFSTWSTMACTVSFIWLIATPFNNGAATEDGFTRFV